MEMMDMAGVSHRPLSCNFGLLDDLVMYFSPRDKASLQGGARLVSSSDLICSNISSSGGRYGWSEVLLGWQRG